MSKDQLFFSRDTKVYVKQGFNIWAIPVLDGFSYSQATNSSEITLNEMSSIAGVSRRARQMFTDSYAPAEWSFSTYARPYIASTLTGDYESSVANHRSVEEALWANFMAVNSATISGAALTLGAITSTGTGRVEGTYLDVATTGGTGQGLTVDITVGATGSDASDVTVAIRNPGVGYTAADAITIPLANAGGGTADLEFTVATANVNAGNALTIGAGNDGVPTSTATDRDPGCSVVVALNTATAPGYTTATGTAATFKITFTDTGADADALVEIISPGVGFAATDVVTVPSTIVGGTGNFTFTVNTVQETSFWDKAVFNTTTEATYSFANSNTTELGTFELFFALGSCSPDTPNVYKIDNSCINSVNVNFDIDGIATLEWSGFGSIITEEATEPVPTITEAAGATSNFIRNRLTTLAIQAGDDSMQDSDGTAGVWTYYPGENSDGVYNVVLTGGSIAFENNITYLTPETLCVVNQPIGHVTGTRSAGGSFTCYLNANTGSSADLFEDIIEGTNIITNRFALTFTLGGASAPKIGISFPYCHLEVPTHGIEDVISVETNFHALPSSIDSADEATITYTGTTY